MRTIQGKHGYFPIETLTNSGRLPDILFYIVAFFFIYIIPKLIGFNIYLFLDLDLFFYILFYFHNISLYTKDV